MSIVRAAVVVLALTGGSVSAEEAVLYNSYMEGNALHQRCQASTPSSRSICAGYMLGIADAMFIVGNAIEGRRMCVPEAVDGLQIIDVGKAFLTVHPEKRHQAAATLVAEALSEAFPCQ
jgi:hypothetical protein